MTRVALDSNILIYAELEPDSEKGARAVDIILRAAMNGVIPAQALGEFIRFIQRRAPTSLPGAIKQVGIYRAAFLTPPTTDEIIARAAETAEAHHLQLWDCVIAAASAAAGAKVLLTEDMRDGRLLNGLRLINPFAPENGEAVAELM
ncbi:MAG: PIN domain-containing protein [Pseudomonadota bacterium]